MKRISVAIIFFLFSSLTFAQESFSHSIGVSGFLGTRNATLNSIGIVYSPRSNLFKISETSTISIGTNFGIAYNIDNNFLSGSQITFHIPVIIDYNFGLASNKNNRSFNSGGFFGIGYSFDQAGFMIDGGNKNELIKKAMSGPIANIGYRFKIESQPFGVRGSYLYGTGEFSGGYLLTLSLQYILN